MVFGTSIILKLESEATMPVNFCIQVGIGSTAMKQLKFLENITQKLKILVLQYGTKIFWETARGPMRFSKNWEKTIDECRTKIDNNKFLSKIPLRVSRLLLIPKDFLSWFVIIQ